MKITIHKNFDEIKNTRKKRRNQLINIIVVLLFGIYCINESDTILSIMGGLMIAAGSLPLFLWYIVPAIFFLVSKVIHKLRRRTTMFDNSKLDKKHIVKTKSVEEILDIYQNGFPAKCIIYKRKGSAKGPFPILYEGTVGELREIMKSDGTYIYKNKTVEKIEIKGFFRPTIEMTINAKE